MRPLLGRDGELATVDAWLTRVAAAGNAALLVIAGEPGIGKTTLWGEATRRAGAMGYRVLSSRPVPSDAGLPGASPGTAPLDAGERGALSDSRVLMSRSNGYLSGEGTPSDF